MSTEIDTTKPSIGRIYDYLLGGTQNFNADQAVGAALLKACPEAADIARLQRWFLHLIARLWSDEGPKQVLDLGSGLPTQGHFDTYFTDGRVLFTDNDALTVAYGQKLLKDRPNMGYLRADLRDPGALVEGAAPFFERDQRLGIGLIGISYFLTDDELRRLAQALYDFAAPKSALAITYFMPPPPGGAAASFMDTYHRMMNIKLHERAPDQIAALIAPWRVTVDHPFEKWLAIEPRAEEQRLSNVIQGNGLLAARD